MASSPRSCACGHPAWNDITNACPVVCITACALSKLRLLMRVRIRSETPTHAAAPALRHCPAALPTAADKVARSTLGYFKPKAVLETETSPADPPWRP